MEIKLVPLEVKDADQVFFLTSNPEVTKYMRFDTHNFKEEAIALIQSYTKRGSLGFRITKACQGEDEKIIGIAAMKEGEEDKGEYSVSIFIVPEYWNKGYSTQVLDKLKEIAYERGGSALSAYIVEENIGSRKVVEKCGFRLKKIMHFEDMDSGLYVYEYII